MTIKRITIKSPSEHTKVKKITSGIPVAQTIQAGLSSSDVQNLVDSAYVQARVTFPDAGTDSSTVSAIIVQDVDKAFVDALNVDADTLDGQHGTYYLDYNNLANTPSAYGNTEVAAFVDSAYVQARVTFPDTTDSAAVSNIIIDEVDKAFVESLNINADMLDGNHGAYYLDYNNFTNTPTIPAAYGDADVTSLVDSAYVQARQSGVDSSAVTNLIDSDYINARVDAVSAGTDSATVRTIADEQIALADTHDSAAVLGQINATVNQSFIDALDTHDSAAVQAQIDATVNALDTHDSAAVQGQIDVTVNALDTHDSAAVQAQIDVTVNALDTHDSAAVQGQIDTTLAGDVTVGGNLTVDGYIAGPTTMTIDPATVGTDSGTLVILGNLQVEGETTTVNSTVVSISDKNIVLADSATNAAQADDAGITINGANATIQYKSTGDKWEFNKPLFHGADRVLTTADDLHDSDLVQGQIDTTVNALDTHDSAATLAQINAVVDALDTHDSAAVLGQINATVNQSFIDNLDTHDSAAVQGQIDATVNALDTHDSAAVVGQINDVVDQTFVHGFIDQSFIDTFDTHDSAAVSAQISDALIAAGSLDSAAVATIADDRIAATDLHDSAAVDGQIDAAFAAKSTTDVQEGSNLYYTQSRFDTAFTGKSTSNLSEGSNLYYTTARFDSRFNTKTTSNLPEGSNQYYTTTRANSAIDTRVTQSFVNNLNVDADTLDGQHGTHYLDYTNFTNTPNILDSNHVDALIDSGINVASIGDLADVDLTNIQQGYVIKWDSAQSKFIAAVDATAGGAGLEADTLDGQHGTYYLDYNNFTNTPNVLDSNHVSAIIIDDVDQAFIDTFDTHDSAAVDGQIDAAFVAKSTSNLSEGSNLYYTSARANADFDTRLATKSTSNLQEGSNLYYTTTRANSAIDARVTQSYVEGKVTQTFIDTFDTHDSAAVQGQIDTTIAATDTHDSAAVQGQIDATFVANSTTDLSEGDNLYYTTARVDSAFDVRLATKSTTDVSEGTNLYYTTVRADSAFDVRLTTKTTTDVAEGDNLYYTQTRVDSAIDARVGQNFVDQFDTHDSALVSGQINNEVTFNFVDALAGVFDSSHIPNLELGTDTHGNYVSTVTGTTNEITVSGNIGDVVIGLPSNVTIDSNLTVNGYIAGPSNMVIDPATVGTDSGTLTILGNLVVEGETTTVNSTTVTISDKNIVLADSATNNTQANDAGITVNGSNAAMQYKSTGDKWEFNKAPYYLTERLLTTADDLHDSAAVQGQIDSNFEAKSTSDLSEGSNLYYTTVRVDSAFDVRLATKTTTDVAEGNNLYYTTVRVDSDIDAAFVAKSTSDLSEGSNLYYTTARADSDAKNAVSASGDLSYDAATGVFSIDVEEIYTKANFDSDLVAAFATDAVTTTGLTEGDNLYYTKARVDSDIDLRITSKTTTDVAEGNNLYYTTARADSAFDVRLATKTTTDVAEGNNLYYTTARADSDAKNAVSASGDLSYDPVTGVFSFDVESVYTKANFDSDFNAALDEAALQGVGLAYDDATNTLRIDSAELAAFALPIRSYFSAGGDLSYDAATGEFTFDVESVYTKANFDSDLGLALSTNAVTTTNVSEGTNLYYTTARADSAFDVRLATKSTTDVAEGDNLYYTTARADSAFDVRLATKTTTDVAEGDNLYYTTARADSDARYAVSAAGDLSYDPVTGVFSFDVEDVYTKSNFDSDFNVALDEAALGGIGLAYDQSTNTLRIDSAELSAFALPIRSYVSASGDLSYDASTGVFSIDVEEIYTKANFDSDLSLALSTNAVTTTDVSEGTNLYYTTARADSAFDVRLATKTTTDVAEGSNLYYTTARADSDAKNAVSASGDLSYDASTGVFSIDVEDIYTKANFDSDLVSALATDAVTTTNLTEGNNLYYTTARVDSAIDVRVDSDFIRPFIDQAFVDTFDTHDSAAVVGQIGLEVTKTFVDALNVDADTVDGLHANQFLRSDADDTTTGSLTVEGNLTTSNLITFEGDSATVANLTTAIVATASMNSVQAIEATVVSVNATSGERQVSRVLLTHDTTDTYMNEYAVINTGASDEFTLDADTSGGNFRLKLDNVSGNTLFAKSSITYL